MLSKHRQRVQVEQQMQKVEVCTFASGSTTVQSCPGMRNFIMALGLLGWYLHMRFFIMLVYWLRMDPGVETGLCA